MVSPKEVVGLIEGAGGKVDEIGRLPDGSGFATASFSLPKDHWLYKEGHDDPPMPIRMGKGERITITWSDGRVAPPRTRAEFAEMVRAVGRYAVRASTMNGKIDDWDPDAVLQNLVVGMLGYWTTDGKEST
jgi:hypothetical protein